MVKKTESIKNELNQKQQSLSNISIPQLVQTRNDVNDMTNALSSHIEALRASTKGRIWRNWAFVLAEISMKAPNTIQIQDLRSQDPLKLEIQGIAINYDAINDFVNKLTSCKTISSAQLADAKQNTQYGNGVMDYSIICSLAQ